jgi:hypothetical protein
MVTKENKKMKPVFTNHIRTVRRQDAEFNVSLSKRRAWYASDDEPLPTPAPVIPPVIAIPLPDLKPELKFTQDDVNAVVGNRVKEATAAARKALFKELGIDAEDPKAIDTVKSQLVTAQQAAEAQKTAEQKALDKIASLEKERDEAQRAADKANVTRIASKVDSKLETLASKAGAVHPADVIEYLRSKQADKVAALLNTDESVDEKKANELIAEVKKARDNWFQVARGAGSPSFHEGKTPGTDDQTARDESFRRARRAT